MGIGFVVLVGLSGGTMALQGDASASTVGLAVLGGTVFGAALLWYLRRAASELEAPRRRI